MLYIWYNYFLGKKPIHLPSIFVYLQKKDWKEIHKILMLFLRSIHGWKFITGERFRFYLTL